MVTGHARNLMPRTAEWDASSHHRAIPAGRRRTVTRDEVSKLRSSIPRTLLSHARDRMSLRFALLLPPLAARLAGAQGTALRVPGTVDTIPNDLTLIVH